MAAMILAVTALTLFGQQAPPSALDVASIKPAIAQGFPMVRPLPGRLTANASLQMLMQNAYAVQSFQIASRSKRKPTAMLAAIRYS